MVDISVGMQLSFHFGAGNQLKRHHCRFNVKKIIDWQKAVSSCIPEIVPTLFFSNETRSQFSSLIKSSSPALQCDLVLRSEFPAWRRRQFGASRLTQWFTERCETRRAKRFPSFLSSSCPSTHPTPSCVTSRPLVNRPLVGKSGRGCSCSVRRRGSNRNWGQCVSNVHRPHDCQCHGHSRTRPGHCSADRPTALQAFITFPNFLTFLYWQVKVGGWHLLRWNENKIVITQPKRVNSIKWYGICQSCGRAVQNMKQWIQARACFAGEQSCVSGRGQLKWNTNSNITIF